MSTPVDYQQIAARAMASVQAAASTQPAKTDPSTAAQVQLKMYQEQQKRLQAQVSRLTKQANELKGQKGAHAQVTLGRVNAQLKAANATLAAVGRAYSTAQNKYYEATGQYGKLLQGSNRDAFLALETVFKNYGLQSLAGKIYDYVKNGYSSDTISILLQDTKEYKERFAANDVRIKAGLPVLSPADYINTENSMRAVLRQSGLPEGFYDDNKDFTEWIAKGVSPTEVQSRVDLATQATALANPFYKQALNQMGIDDGHMTAYFLDADRSLPLLQKAAATAAVGQAALAQGLTFNQTYAEQLATSGVTAAQAQQGYSQIAQELGTMKELGNVYGQAWTQAQSEGAAFGTSAAATAEKASLVGQERGAFGGGTGTGRAGLSTSQSQR